MTIFSGIKDEVKSLLAAAEDDLGVFFKSALDSVSANGGTAMMGLVADAVAAAEETGGTGAQKLDAVKTAVAHALVARDLPVVWNAVNLAIEATVAHMHVVAGTAPTNHAPEKVAADPDGIDTLKTDPPSDTGAASAELKAGADQNGTAA